MNFDNIVSKKIKMQDINLNLLKHKMNNTQWKNEKKTTNFELSDDLDVTNKACLDKTLSK